MRDDVKFSSERIVFVRFVMINIACVCESVDDERKNGEKMTKNGLELVILWLFLLLLFFFELSRECYGESTESYFFYYFF